jgi:hypothetical protein
MFYRAHVDEMLVAGARTQFDVGAPSSVLSWAVNTASRQEWLSPDEARAWLESYSVDQGEYGDMSATESDGR